MLGRHEESATAAAEGLDLARRVGSARTVGAYLAGNLVEAMLRLGRWAVAEETVAEETVVEAGRTGPTAVFAVTLLDPRAHLAVLTGRRAEAEELLTQLWQRLRGRADTQLQLTTAATEAECRRLAGDLTGARDLIAERISSPAIPWFGRSIWPLLWLGMRIEADIADLAGTPPDARRANPHAERLSAVAATRRIGPQLSRRGD